MIPAVRAIGRRNVSAPSLPSDSFARADSATSMGTADTGQVWTYPSGTWGISSGAAYAPGASGSAGASVNTGIDPSVSGGFVEVGVALSGASGFTGRYPLVFIGAASGATHTSAFRLYVDGTAARVVLQNGTGATAIVSSLSIVNGTRLSLRAYAASGGNMLLSARINGVEVTTLTAPSRTGTYAGIGTGSASDGDIRFDDFAVTQ